VPFTHLTSGSAEDKEKGREADRLAPKGTKVSGFASLRLTLSAAFLGALLYSPHLAAQSAATPAQSITLGPSGLPLPRFVSLKSGRVNSRVGPGANYSVDWMYMKAGLPMEIIQEFDTWRRVRDADGSEGWINQSLLSGRRTAIVAPWQRGKGGRINLLYSADKDASVVAIVEPGVMGTIKTCDGQWCEMTFEGHTGWLAQSLVWGAYPGEHVKN
jgi:SH3-like domain-containing protein